MKEYIVKILNNLLNKDNSLNNESVQININNVNINQEKEIKKNDFLIWENEFPYLKDNVAKKIYETLRMIENNFEKIQNIEDLEFEKKAKAHHLVNYDVKEYLKAYLKIPKNEANGLVIKNNKTAKELLIDKLINLNSIIEEIYNNHYKKKTNDFLNVSERIENEREIAIRSIMGKKHNIKSDFREFYKTSKNEDEMIDMFLNAFTIFNSKDMVNNHLEKIYSISFNSSKHVDDFIQLNKITQNDLDYLHNFIKDYEDNKKTLNSIILQNIILNKTKADIINFKINEEIINIEKINCIYQKDIYILENIINKLNLISNKKIEIFNFINNSDLENFRKNLLLKETIMTQQITMFKLLVDNYQKVCDNIKSNLN